MIWALILPLTVASTYAVHAGYYGQEGGGFEEGPAHYKFSYGVADPHTGDFHQQHEFADGHGVKGAYSLKEPDGTTRLVEYLAGPHSGFNAVVKRIGHAQHPLHYKTYGGGGGGGGGFGGGYGGAIGGGGHGGGFGGAHSHVGVAHFGYHH